MFEGIKVYSEDVPEGEAYVVTTTQCKNCTRKIGSFGDTWAHIWPGMAPRIPCDASELAEGSPVAEPFIYGRWTYDTVFGDEYWDPGDE